LCSVVVALLPHDTATPIGSRIRAAMPPPIETLSVIPRVSDTRHLAPRLHRSESWELSGGMGVLVLVLCASGVERRSLV